MCGIVGVVRFDEAAKWNELAVVQQMVQTLAHRGPDDNGDVAFSKGVFGHRRLAIIDVKYGRQPMKKQIGDCVYWITYNGELYNTEILRAQLLEKGYTFSTKSDTEVLLTSYIEWGPQCAEKLDGIFAFGIWDETQETLFLCRDRLGVKPLYYSELNKGVVFASEMKALLQYPSIEPVVTVEKLGQLLAFGPMRIPGETIFEQIAELLPGEWLIAKKGSIQKQAYWQLPTSQHDLSVAETIEEVRHLVEEAVKKQLVSDVAVCTFLSGGIDSSIITAIASDEFAQKGEKLHTFSVEYEGNEQYFKSNAFQPTTDRAFIEKLATQLPIEHTEIIIGQEELAEHLWTALTLKDYPSMTDIDSSLYIFCREVKKDFSVALSGECADELFGGYPWFLERSDGFPWVRSLKQRESLLNAFWRDAFDYEQIVEQKWQEAKQRSEQVMCRACSEEEQTEQRMSYMNYYYFMQTLLERKDRMSMGAGLEVRVPFADHRLVERMWRVPLQMKRLGDVEKGLLREAMKDRLPTEIYARKKSPYPKTMHPLYTRVVEQMLRDALSDKGSMLYQLFDEAALYELMGEDASSLQLPWFGQLMARPQLIAYLVQLNRWFQHYGVRIKE